VGIKLRINEKINKLTLLKEVGSRKYGKDNQLKKIGLFLCDCGNEKKIVIKSVEYEKN